MSITRRKTSRSRQSLTGILFVIFSFLLAGHASAISKAADFTGIEDSVTLNLLLNQDIRELTVTADGEWVVVTESNLTVFSSGIPSATRLAIQGLVPFGIDAIALDHDGGEYAITAGVLTQVSNGVHNRDLLQQKITVGRYFNGNRITELAFTADGDGWFASAGPWSAYDNCPDDFIDAVEDTIASRRVITGVAFGGGGSWALLTDNWFASSDVSAGLFGELQDFLRSGDEISQVAISDGGYVVYAQDDFEPDHDVMELLESSPLVGGNIYQRMHDANVAGISLALIIDNKIEYQRGYGVLEAGSQQWVRTDSPFDLASLSKFLGALTQMTLVESGDLSLSTDAFLLMHQYYAAQETGKNLYKWYEWNAQAGRPVPPGLTLGRLLSHSAGLQPHASASYPSTSNASFATSDLLEDVYWDPAIGMPGNQYDYSGGGFLLADAMAEDVTGEDFADLMQNRVFDALGMADSTAEQPLTGTWEDRAAEMHNSSGAKQSRSIYPWHSAGGVYASAADYARAMIVLMRNGKDENGDRFISRWAADQMLSDWAPGSNKYGLGIRLRDGAFTHGGSHPDKAKTEMKADLDDNTGIVILVNGEGDAINALVDDIASDFFLLTSIFAF